MNRPTKRDMFGNSHGAGKGDKPRHKLDDNYRANFDAIKFPPKTEEGFTRTDGKLTKRYGPAAPTKFEDAPLAHVVASM